MTTGDLLDALYTALLKREKYWSEVKEDPHGIATAVMVALSEVREAVEEVIEEDEH